jgi:hypothetical protein
MRNVTFIQPKKLLSLAFLLALTLPYFTLIAHAEDAPSQAFGVVMNVNLNDKDIKEGDIVVLSGKDPLLSNSPYQNIILGVISPNPAYTAKPTTDISVNSNGGSSYKVIISGNALVNVNGKNGAIKKGDLLTTSSDKAVGFKAVKSGYVLGSALEDYSPGNQDEVKKILVAVNVHYYDTGSSIKTKITDIFKLAALAAYEQPRLALKYIASSLVIIVTIVFSFISVGKIARLGIIALGRNPMASGKIYKGILVNTISSVAIIASGLMASYFLLKI